MLHQVILLDLGIGESVWDVVIYTAISSRVVIKVETKLANIRHLETKAPKAMPSVIWPGPFQRFESP